MSDNIMSNNITGDNFVSENITTNNTLKIIRHYFESASMTCAYSHDKLIIQSDNRGEVRINISLINDELHQTNIRQAITENFYNVRWAYYTLLDLRHDLVKYGCSDIFDPKLAELLHDAVNITLYNDAKNQRWAKCYI